MTNKKDWETVLKENENQRDQLIKNYEMALPQIEAVIEMVKKKIDQYTLEEIKDPVPDEIKKVIKEVKE